MNERGDFLVFSLGTVAGVVVTVLGGVTYELYPTFRRMWRYGTWHDNTHFVEVTHRFRDDNGIGPLVVTVETSREMLSQDLAQSEAAYQRFVQIWANVEQRPVCAECTSMDIVQPINVESEDAINRLRQKHFSRDAIQQCFMKKK